MTVSARLAMPLIAAEQAQKHITHNEALLLLDALVQLRFTEMNQTEPPEAPGEGTTYDIGADAEAGWAGHDGEIAHRTPGGWRFVVPQDGWLAFDEAGGRFMVRRAGAWAGLLEQVEGLGIGALADETNRLSVRSEAALFSAIPADAGGSGTVRLTLNRETPTDSATLIFQSGWSGRAEIGLAGNDDFAFKVSPDGAGWTTAMTLDAGSGFVRFEQMMCVAISHPVVVDGTLEALTGHIVPSPQEGSADDIDFVSGGPDGALLIVTGTEGVALTFRTGIGNLRLGADRIVDGAADSLLLVRRGSDWIELSYASNA